MGKWKVAKRPGVDMFLFYMAHLYEVVLFSSMNQFVSETWDPLMLTWCRALRRGTPSWKN